MPTFYKYAERNANSQLNWGDIGKSMSETLAESSRLREEKRAKIDADTNKLNETLINAPRGEDANGNAFTLQYADDATKYMLMINKLLKSGNMDVRQYTTNMANITSNTNTAFKVQNEFQAQAKSLRERAESNDPANKSQQLEQDYNDFLKTFGDLSSSRLMINPTDGNVTVGKIDPSNPTKLLPQSMLIGDLWKGATMKFNYYDSQKASTNIAAGLAPYILDKIKEGSVSTPGTITTVDNALAKPETKTMVDKQIAAQLTNKFNATSILTNNIGGYTSVFLKSEYDKMSPEEKEKVIFYDNSKGYPEAELTKGQMKIATEYLQGDVYSKIKNSETINQFVSQELTKYGMDQDAASAKAARDLQRDMATSKDSTPENFSAYWRTHMQNQMGKISNNIINRNNITSDEMYQYLIKTPGMENYKIVTTGNKGIKITAPNKKAITMDWETIPSKNKMAQIADWTLRNGPGADVKEENIFFAGLDKKGIFDYMKEPKEKTTSNDPLGIK
jgi:hypothetical protein